MQTVVMQPVSSDAPPTSLKATQQAGEDAARAVARMRHLAIDNWDQVAHFTQAALAENNLSYREQELHSGVGASTVYRMALGNAVGVRAVQQFAAFATYAAHRPETKAFWAGTLSRFKPTDSADASSTDTETEAPRPEEIAALYAQLVRPSSRKAVMDLLRDLKAAEAAR